jgi:hypothetical protein
METKLTAYRSNIKANAGEFYRKFSSAPLGLRAFAIFSVLVTVLHVSISFLAKDDMRSLYSEKFGISAGNSYMFTLFFTFLLILSPKGTRPDILRFGIVIPLIITLSLKCLFLLNILDDRGKFEKSGSWGLVWAIVIPAIWVIVLFSPAVSSYCSRINSKK